MNEPYLDLARFFTTAMHRGKPQWLTPNQEVYEDSAVVLRRFDSGRPGDPILIVPPQAGHHSSIADYEKDHSLVQACLNNARNPLYVMEWKPSTLSRRNESIDDLAKQLMICIKKIRRPVILAGLCQGGWLSVIYTALFPDDVKSLILAAAPIDFTAGGGRLQDLVQSMPLMLYQNLVCCGGGNMSGDMMLLGWKMLNPYDRFIKDYLNLWVNVRDAGYLHRTKKFQEWYEYTQDISGKWYIEAVDKLFVRNSLVKGELIVLGEPVDLGNIACPLALLAGQKDDITLVPQVFNIAEYVSTPKEKVFRAIIPEAGHISVFMGSRALRHEWPQALRFVLGEQGSVQLETNVAATA
jgi:poly(3-hydroxybutyrate) depolymerase